MLADVQDGVSGHDAATRKEFEERCCCLFFGDAYFINTISISYIN